MIATKVDEKVTRIEPSLPASITNTEDVSFVPEIDPTFVPFGQFKDIHNIIKSNLFYTGFITGLSGNKTFLVELELVQKPNVNCSVSTSLLRLMKMIFSVTTY